MSVLVYIDSSNGKLVKSAAESVTYAHKIASQMGSSVVAAVAGNVDESTLAGLGAYGAGKVVHCSGIASADSLQVTKFVTQVAGDNQSKVIVFAHDATGKTVAGGVAIKLNAGHVSGAIALPDMSSGFVVKRAVFSGKAFANYAIDSEVKVISLTPNSIAPEETGGSASVESFTGDVGSPGLTVKEVKGNDDEISLPDADLVVSAGRGLKGPENWGMVEDLAKELGAATACSRPVADIGWRPHHEHVGQTGVTVRPNLYIAIGISGAIQHLAGVNSSKTIVVINNDPEAPFFKAADYGIVGDAFEVVPRLIEAVKNHKN